MQPNTRLKQQHTTGISPKQIQLFNLLQTPNILLEQQIKEELEKNIVLEFSDTPKENENNSNSETPADNDIAPNKDYDEDPMERYDNTPAINPENHDLQLLKLKNIPSLHDTLLTQCAGLPFDDTQQFIAKFIIGNLDANGLLTKSNASILNDLLLQYDLNISEQEFTSVLSYIQDLEPLGIAARSISDCLLKQLSQIHPYPYLSEKIITLHYDDLIHNKNEKIMRSLQLKPKELKKALSILQNLYPYPLQQKEMIQNIPVQKIHPDFILHEEAGKLRINFTRQNIIPIRISSYYTNMLEKYKKGNNKKDNEVYSYIKDKIIQAQNFLENLKSREKILLQAMETIVAKQKKYFLSGMESDLQPMTLKDIALPLQIDISTMSRIVNHKYLQTDKGIFPLKHFFLRPVSNRKGGLLNTHLIQESIQQIIETENAQNPYSDEQIEKILQTEKNIHISRRTVAKYRQKMNILPSEQRKNTLNI